MSSALIHICGALLLAAQAFASLDSSSAILQRALHKKCLHAYTPACFKMEVVALVDKLSAHDSYQVLPSISMVRHNVTEGEGQGRSAGGADSMESVMAAMAQDGDENRLDGLLIERMSRYLDTHAISVRLFDDAALEKMRSVNQDVTAKYSHIFAQSGRGKDKKGAGALLMGLMMMKATLGALGFGAIAALAGKALLVGLLAMMLSAIVGLKSLASGGGKSVTYEIVSKPVYSHSNTHSSEHEYGGHGGHASGSSYGHRRSMDAVADHAHTMAYAGQH